MRQFSSDLLGDSDYTVAQSTAGGSHQLVPGWVRSHCGDAYTVRSFAKRAASSTALLRLPVALFRGEGA
jgi:hypothetical protein